MNGAALVAAGPEGRPVAAADAVFTPLPAGLADLPAGPALATALASVDRSSLNGLQLVEVLSARARQIAFEQAQLLADMHELAYTPPIGRLDEPARRGGARIDHVADEIALALSWSPYLADRYVVLAWAARERLPVVIRALADGVIDLTKARMICDELACVDDAHATRVATALLDDEATTIASCGTLRERIRRMIASIDPDAARTRRRRSVEDRTVFKTEHNDGTTTITAQGIPTEKAAAAWEHLCRTAMGIKKSGDTTGGAGERTAARRLHQIRADAFVDLLGGVDPASAGTARPGPAKGTITLTVGLGTLMCLDDQAAEIDGFGPVAADIARQLAADQAENLIWRFAVTSNGRVVYEGRLRYRPTPAQIAYVRSRDRRCLIPGCRRPAQQCDVDHIATWNDYGPTHEDNLCLLCRRHHRAKHGGFRLYRTDFGYVWLSPRGQIHPISLGRELNHDQRRLLHNVIQLTETRRPPRAGPTRRRRSPSGETHGATRVVTG